MKLAIPYISIFLMINACAPMPGGRFLKGVDHITELEDIPELIIHDVNIFQSTAICNYLLFQERPFLALIAMGGVPACCDVEIDGKGGVKKCEVWAPGDAQGFFMKHELEHCKGWADKLY